MNKKKITLLFRPTFSLDVTEWFESERLTLKEKKKKLEEDFSDISVFGSHSTYENLKGVEVQVDIEN